MKKLFLLMLAAGLLAGCATSSTKSENKAAASTPVSQQARVIDVRSPEEYAAGHLPGAINIPVDQVQQKIAEVEPDKNAPLMVHCQGGGRSARATGILKGLGYTNVRDLGSFENARKVVEPANAGSAN